MSSVLFGDQRVSFEHVHKLIPATKIESRVKEVIVQWQAGRETFPFKTSGSTGAPKNILLHRDQLLQSAKSTISALKLAPGQTSLLAINPDFIGGTMMIIRALINKMRLIVLPPSSNPLKDINEDIDFAAFVPLQLHEITNNPEAREKLNHIKKVIVGGGAVQQQSLQLIQHLNCEVYATYGMTETASHIALRRLNGTRAANTFKALENVLLKTDQRGCLVINGPQTNNEDIITNDLTELINETEFKWLGRIDNVINTGGVKVNSEVIEQVIEQVLFAQNIQNPFFTAGVYDQRLGEKILLFIEGDTINKDLITPISAHLAKYELPKEVIHVPKFVRTSNGKIDRKNTVKIFLSEH